MKKILFAILFMVLCGNVVISCTDPYPIDETEQATDQPGSTNTGELPPPPPPPPGGN